MQNEKESVLQKKFEIDAKVINMNEKMRSYLELEKESNIKGLRQDYENVTNNVSGICIILAIIPAINGIRIISNVRTLSIR